MNNLVCQNCKSIAVEYEDYIGGTLYYRCKTCGMRGSKDKFTQTTIFDLITTSVKVLAEEFVEPYTRWGEDGYLETLWRSNFRELSGMLFDTKEEAVFATEARLKETEK